MSDCNTPLSDQEANARMKMLEELMRSEANEQADELRKEGQTKRDVDKKRIVAKQTEALLVKHENNIETLANELKT
jgi:hypothetical protein